MTEKEKNVIDKVREYVDIFDRVDSASEDGVILVKNAYEKLQEVLQSLDAPVPPMMADAGVVEHLPVIPSMRLTVENLDSVFQDCVPDSDIEGSIIGECYLSRFAFSEAKIQEHRAEIMAMLLQLPADFMESTLKGGCSVYSANVRADGTIWAKGSEDIERLFALGDAAKCVEALTTDRNVWLLLPNRQPMYCVMDQAYTLEKIAESTQS